MLRGVQQLRRRQFVARGDAQQETQEYLEMLCAVVSVLHAPVPVTPQAAPLHMVGHLQSGGIEELQHGRVAV